MKIWACLRQTTLPKIDEICPWAIPNQISTISMHIPGLVKIHWCLLKLSSGNEKWMDWLTDNQRETLIPRLAIVWQGIKMEWKSVLRRTVSLLPELKLLHAFILCIFYIIYVKSYLSRKDGEGGLRGRGRMGNDTLEQKTLVLQSQICISFKHGKNYNSFKMNYLYNCYLLAYSF